MLLGEIQSQLDQAKTHKQKLAIYRDRALVGIMSLEECRRMTTIRKLKGHIDFKSLHCNSFLRTIDQVKN